MSPNQSWSHQVLQSSHEFHCYGYEVSIKSVAIHFKPEYCRQYSKNNLTLFKIIKIKEYIVDKLTKSKYYAFQLLWDFEFNLDCSQLGWCFLSGTDNLVTEKRQLE